MKKINQLFPILIFTICVLNGLNAQVKIGDNPKQINDNALLELESTNKGILLPRMTSAQRDAAFKKDIPNGLIIYNTDTQLLEVWQASSKSWYSNDIQKLSLENHKLILTNGGEVDISSYQQTISLIDNQLRLTNGGEIDMTPYMDDTDSQKLTYKDGFLTLENGGSIQLAELVNTNSSTIAADNIANNPDFPTKLVANTAFTDALAVDDNFESKLVSNTTFTEALASDQTFTTKLGTNSSNFTTGLASNTSFIDNLIANNDFSEKLAEDDDFESKLVSNTTFTDALATDNNFESKLAANTAFTRAIANVTNTDTQTVYVALKGNELQVKNDNQTASSTVDLSVYTNTDTQTLAYDSTSDKITLTDGGEVNAGELFKPNRFFEGSVGIGVTTTTFTTTVSGSTASAKTYSLMVRGTIGFRGDLHYSGAMSSTTFPDYVFESYFDGISSYNPDYRLPELREVANYVKENKHLPGVQSRDDIKQRGYWDLTENIRTNLEKVEELYLYTIEQQKRIEFLETENRAYHKTLEALIKRLEALENTSTE